MGSGPCSSEEIKLPGRALLHKYEAGGGLEEGEKERKKKQKTLAVCVFEAVSRLSDSTLVR